MRVTTELPPEQLQAAWHLVQQGSQAAGVDGVSVDLFAGDAPHQLHTLHRQLQRDSYQAQPAKGFHLAKKSGGHRLIGIPTVRDRIVQRLLLQHLYPTLEARLSESAFAYRPGRSIYQAIARVMERYQYQPAWVVKADIQQFFDQLAWPVLLSEVDQLAAAPSVQGWLEQQLRAGVVVQGQWQRATKGVPQGSALSGALANLYLAGFDRRCLEAGIHLVRYGDDCVAVCASLLQASRTLALMADWLQEVYLDLHPDKTQVVPPDGEFIFLGHHFAQGQVLLPPWRQAAADRPKPRAKTRSKTGGRPPQVCSLVRQSFPSSPVPDHYWSDEMTTLYISEQGSYLRTQHQQFQVLHDRELRCAVPVNRVSHVVVFGCCNVSHGAVSLALRRRIPILYLANNGRYFGRLQTDGHAQVDYLIEQVQKSQDSAFKLRQAQQMVQAKLKNSRTVLQRLNRRQTTPTATEAIEKLAALIEQVPQIEALDVLLGWEGQGSALYFRAFATLLKGDFQFEKRTRRPPTDPINSLLSLGYTLLHQNIYSMVEAAGLHPHFGNLHLPQKNRPSLVCDLMEEFRAFAVDLLVAYLINSNIFTEEDFTPPDDRGGVYLFPDALKKFLKHWEDKLQQSVTHPHTGYKVSYRRCLELQVWEYVACLTGEQEQYRPMVWPR